MVEKDEGIYAPAHSRDGFDARQDGDENRGPLLLVVTMAVLLAFAAVVYTAYQQGLRKGGRDAAPHVAAEPGPIKTKPTETHGTPTPNLGNKAYEPLDDIKAAPVEKIKTAPLAEEPMQRPTRATQTPKPTPPAARQEPPAPVEIKPEPKAEPVREAAPATKRTADPQVVSDGAFLVQIAAFRSEDQALAAWGRLAGKLGQATSALKADVQRADLGAKGVYYRLRAASFADRAGAAAFCDQLKQSGQDCIVVHR
jgi:cell division protein FtsN